MVCRMRLWHNIVICMIRYTCSRFIYNLPINLLSVSRWSNNSIKYFLNKFQIYFNRTKYYITYHKRYYKQYCWRVVVIRRNSRWCLQDGLLRVLVVVGSESFKLIIWFPVYTLLIYACNLCSTLICIYPLYVTAFT